MQFLDLCVVFEMISKTSKRLEKTALLADFLSRVSADDMESVMLLLKGRVFPEWDKTTIGISQKLAIKVIALTSGVSESDVVKRFKKAGDLGEVAEGLASNKRQMTLAQHSLSIADVVRSVKKLATIEGTGSVDQKMKTISQMLSNASGVEARFLIRILLEDLRIGIADGTIRDAIIWRGVMDHEGLSYDSDSNAWSGGENSIEILKRWTDAVQTAMDRSNDVASVAVVARDFGIEKLSSMRLSLGVPTKVMLAQRATDFSDAFSRVGHPAALEYKYDGFRMQIHKNGETVHLFTRRLENVTEQFPDVVSAVREHVHGSCILDAEVVGYDPASKRHTPFQAISQRIRRKYEIASLAESLPVEVRVFDILLDGDSEVYPMMFSERRKRLESRVPNVPFRICPSEILYTDDPGEAKKFYELALASGYEGLMFKSLDAPYKPGSRVGFMVKLKPTLDTLDVVVVGAEWGEGKRSGWLTSFTIAIQDEDGQLVEIGKVGTGFKELEQEGGVTFSSMTDLLRELIVSENGKEVMVRPKVVIEVRCEEIQKSPSYSSGFALRFPRMVRVREDRRVADVSSVSEVLDLFEAQKGGHRA